MKKYKHVNRQDFGIIKALLNVKGMKVGMIEKSTGKSYATIKCISKHKNYKSYIARNKAKKTNKLYSDISTALKNGIHTETLEQKVDRILAILSDMKYKKNILGF